jgi:hypothetical protein
MLERWQHVCRIKISFTLLPTNRFVSTKTNLMKCLVNWNLLRLWWSAFVWESLCTFGVCALFEFLLKEYRCAMETSGKKRVSPAGRIGIWHCADFFSQIPKKYTDLDFSLLYILISWTHSKFARTNHLLAPGVCFPQPCSSAGRRFAASRSRLQYHHRIISFLQQKYSMKYLVHWISLRIRVCFRNTQPHLQR